MHMHSGILLFFVLTMALALVFVVMGYVMVRVHLWSTPAQPIPSHRQHTCMHHYPEPTHTG